MEGFTIVACMYTERKYLFFRGKRLKGLKANTTDTFPSKMRKQKKSFLTSLVLFAGIVPTIIT